MNHDTPYDRERRAPDQIPHNPADESPATHSNRERREPGSTTEPPSTLSNRERREPGSIPPYSGPTTNLSNRERREPGSTTPSTGPTGPRTDSGKAISSQNALKHGLTAMKPENAVDPALRAQYDALRRQYLDEFRPQGAIENTLLDLVILAAWQLYKIRAMETFAGLDLGETGRTGHTVRIARYRGNNERLLFRSLSQLRQIQQERALKHADKTRAMPAHLAPGVRLRPIWARLEWLSKPRYMTAGVNASVSKTHRPEPSQSRPPSAA